MTNARKAALAWFHERGEVTWFPCGKGVPSNAMRRRLENEGLIEGVRPPRAGMISWRLTDAGRQALYEATR